jgi:hypothetical protein
VNAGRRGAVLAVSIMMAVVAAGCSDDSSSGDTVATTPRPAAPIAAGDAPLRVELIAEAVAALEAQLGGPQQYFEINATPTLVNLFVATESATQAVAYVYLAGAVSEPADPQPASGPTFTADELAFDPTVVLSRAVTALPDSDFRLFATTGLADGGVQYLLTVRTRDGSDFSVYLAADGTILGTDVGLGAEEP